MPYCPTCGAEYREGIETCAHCREPLVETIEEVRGRLTPEKAAELLEGASLRAVVRGDLPACREVQAALLQEDIPALLRVPEDYDPQPGTAAVLEVVVSEASYDAAVTALVEDWHEMLERDGLDWLSALQDREEDVPACPACGCTDPLVDGSCPDCGLYLGEEPDE